MTLAVLSESQAEEAAIRILVNGILGRETRPVAGPPLRSRGWPSVLNVLPSVLKHLYYRTDAEAFVVVVDSNTSPVHQIGHNLPPRHWRAAVSANCNRLLSRFNPSSHRFTLVRVSKRPSVLQFRLWRRGIFAGGMPALVRRPGLTPCSQEPFPIPRAR